MQAVDVRNMLGPVLSDPSRTIPKAHLNKVCKVNQAGCCRYLAHGVLEKHFTCVKKTKMKTVLDDLVKQNKMVAKGDCCEGLGDAEISKPKQSP